MVGDDDGVEAVAGIAVQGNQALIVAQFADMDAAKAAYYALVDAEAKRAIDIDGVLVANADYQGKVHIQKMTDHKTRNGFLWGAVARCRHRPHLPAHDPRRRRRRRASPAPPSARPAT